MKAVIFVDLLAASAFIALPSLASQPDPSKEQLPAPKEVEPGVFDVPLSLPKSLESRRREFKGNLLEAQKRLRVLIKNNGWSDLNKTPFMKRAEIYDKKVDYDNHLYEIEPALRGKPIPTTFTAGIEQDVFFAVSPEMVDKVFPQGRENDSYIKLIQHELAHRLHVRIVKGNEERMGPVWFYEGFAVYAADQYRKAAPELTDAEIWDIVRATKRGSYIQYRTVFYHFLKQHTLKELLEHAGDADFADWLKTTEKAS